MITLRDLTKKDSRKNVLLDNVNLKIKRGEIFCFLGRNGSGKSTLLLLISSLIKPTKGEIIFDEPKIKKKIKILFQENLIEERLNAFENLKAYSFLVNKSDKEIKDALKFVSLDNQHKIALKFSGGMKRRLEFAKIMLTDFDLLLLDEPTSNIDIEQKKKIWKYIKELKKQGKTIIISTNDIKEAEELSDRVGIMKEGKLTKLVEKKDIDKFFKNKILI